jgi:hypothetical protein
MEEATTEPHWGIKEESSGAPGLLLLPQEQLAQTVGLTLPPERGLGIERRSMGEEDPSVVFNWRLSGCMERPAHPAGTGPAQVSSEGGKTSSPL